MNKMAMIKAMIEAHQETENTDLHLNVDELSYFNYFIFSHSLYYERRFLVGRLRCRCGESHITDRGITGLSIYKRFFLPRR